MDNLTKRALGRTGIEVTQLGFGAAERGLPDEAEYDDQAGGVLNAALDAGSTSSTRPRTTARARDGSAST